jgi:fucose permease
MQGGSVSHGLPASKITENKVPPMRGTLFFGRFLGEWTMKKQGNYKLLIIYSILNLMTLGINP